MSERRYISDMRRRLGLICGFHLGYPGWEHTFLNWARDAGFKISEPTPASLQDRGQP
jgi:hypothetical protein